jgi:hypothetical protein
VPAPLGAQLVLKNVSASAKIMKDLQADTSVDWASWEAKLGPELVAEVKAITEKSIAAAEASAGDDTSMAELTSEANDAFKGPNGLVRLSLVLAGSSRPRARERGPLLRAIINGDARARADDPLSPRHPQASRLVCAAAPLLRPQFELASKEEKAAAAGMEEILKEMEQLESYVEGVADLTIADILEREPELRAQIEEELKNDVWAP